MYRSVHELTRDELNELKGNYFWGDATQSDIELLGDITFPDEIPDEVIYEHYDGIGFVEDDFFCNQTD